MADGEGAPGGAVGLPNGADGTAGVVATGDMDRRLGIDTGLVKLLPDASEITVNGYRRLRRLEIFRKACESRSDKAVTEGCLALLNSLDGSNWDAMEAVELTVFDKPDGFQVFFDVFDAMYRFDPVQEVPMRIEELTLNFRRQKKTETLRVYCMRLDTLALRLKSVGCEFPLADSNGTLASKGSYACEGQRAPLSDVRSG